MTGERSKNSASDRNWLAGDQVSGLPWIPVAAQMHDHAMAAAAVQASKYYRDARTFVETFTEVATYYGLDIIMPEADIYNFEVEGLGGKMVYSDNAMPTVDFREPLIKQPEDLYKLKTPDFHHDGRFPYALEYIRLRRNRFQSTPLGGVFCAIFSLAVGLRGYPALIRDMRKRPEFVHDLFTFVIDQVLIPYIKEQKEYCGVNTAHGADAWACVPNLSVTEIKNWLVPYNQQLASKANAFGVRVTSGTGDYSEEDTSKFDVEVLNGALDVQMACRGGNTISLGMGKWHEYPLEPIRDYTAKYRAQGAEISVLAGVNARLLRDGPVNKIVDCVKRFVDMLGRDHKLTIWLANIPADAAADHVHAAVAAVHAYGRLPIAENLDEIELETPRFPTFPEWKENKSGGTA